MIGLLICFFFVIAGVRMVSGGGRFICTQPHHHESDETARLRREVEAFHEQIKKQTAVRG